MAIPDSKIRLQIVWAVALVLAGIGVFVRIPQVMPRIESIQQFAAARHWIRFCFYLLGVLLIVGGGRKLYQNLRALSEKDGKAP